MKCGKCKHFKTDDCKRFEELRDGRVFGNFYHRAVSWDPACLDWSQHKEKEKALRAVNS